MPQPIVLLEEVSPGAPVMAVVEADGHTVYLYVQGAKDTPYEMRSLWIANTAPAPEQFDRKRMAEGLAPLMPRANCAHPQGLRLADLEPLRLVWLEEGTGVALYGKPGLLGIVPSGELAKCPGFSAGCTQATTLAWPLSAPEAAFARERLASAEAFWARWEADDAWPTLQTELLATIDGGLGREGRYFAADGGEWPPRFVAARSWNDAQVLVTGGVCIRRQPGLAGVMRDADGPKRIELAMAFGGALGPGELERVARYLSANLQLPWLRKTWLGPGHTVPCDSIPPSLGGGAKFDAVLLATELPGAPRLSFAPYGGDEVTLLWLVPITAAERTFAREKGSAPLLEALAKANASWPHRDRAPVVGA